MTEMGDPDDFQNQKVDRFKGLIGIDRLAGLTATDGVLADWHQATQSLSEELHRLRLVNCDAVAFRSGVGLANWDWKRRDDSLAVEIYVSGEGPAGARARLIDKATNTTAVDSQMDLAREKVGEIAVESRFHDGAEILWVFRNICVFVSNFGRGPDVMSVARRIQAFLIAHLVPNIASHVPRVGSIEISKAPIRMGDTFEVQVHSEDRSRRDLKIEVRPASWPLLDPIEYRESSVVFRATDPGPAKLDVILLDPVTLLSPKAGVVIDVLPAL